MVAQRRFSPSGKPIGRSERGANRRAATIAEVVRTDLLGMVRLRDSEVGANQKRMQLTAAGQITTEN
jgi:hypothetical protein